MYPVGYNTASNEQKSDENKAKVDEANAYYVMHGYYPRWYSSWYYNLYSHYPYGYNAAAQNEDKTVDENKQKEEDANAYYAIYGYYPRWYPSY